MIKKFGILFVLVFLTIIFSLTPFCYADSLKNVSTGSVKVIGRNIVVDNKNYTVKSVGYAPVAIGNTPDWGFDITLHPEFRARDFPLIRAMNANTIRTWGKVGQGSFLDDAWNNGTKPLRVIMGYWMGPEKDYQNQTVRNAIKQDFNNYVNAYKNYPAVLVWAIGNEENYFYANGDNTKSAAYFSLVNEMAQNAYSIEGSSYHPVMSVILEFPNTFNTVGNYAGGASDSNLTYVDIWGINNYPGYTFGNYFDVYKTKSSKPLIITEYGIDALNNSVLVEYESIQAKWDVNLWREILNGSVGGSLMEYSDEYWKDYSGNVNIHDYGGYSTSSQPDSFSNEEWWGIMRSVINNSGIDIMQPRQVYYALANEFLEKIPTSYSLNITTNTLGQIEYRLYYNTQHFLSIIGDPNNNGVFAIRPHPGVDVNGWGSTLYLQPFLSGATLKYTKIDSVLINSSGIQVTAHGNISRSTTSTYGPWNTTLNFNYNPILKEIKGSGSYNIKLNGNLSSSTGDLNFYKLASNYLNTTPLITGGFGDTGDMQYTNVTSSNPILNFIWNPKSQPSHFPQDRADNLSVDVSGNLNLVDTFALGYGYSIAPSYKPNLKIKLYSKQSGIRMIFGGIYNLTATKDFTADNVGITPLIQNWDTPQYLNYNFDLEFQSKALPGDGNLNLTNSSVWILHLSNMPFYIKEQTNYSGAAVAAMILNYQRNATNNSTLSQTEIYNYGRQFMLSGNSKLGDFDGKAMMYALGHFDPYDGTDPTGFGNQIRGYNFDVESYNNVTDYIGGILHWMAWNVPKDAWYLAGAQDNLTITPNTPAAIPLYGNYTSWVAVNGGVADKNPCLNSSRPLDPFNITVYGFWLTDPKINGIGQQTFVTAREAASIYFKPLVSNDSYNGKFIQVAEPSNQDRKEKIEFGKNKINNETDALGDIVNDDSALSEIDPTAADSFMPVFAKDRKQLNIKSTVSSQLRALKFRKIDWSKIIDSNLMNDISFQKAFNKTIAQMPIKVKNLETGEYYFIVPFGSKRGNVSVTIMVDSTRSYFKQASWTTKSQNYLNIDRKEALKLAGIKADKANIELIWSSNFQVSPFLPIWRITTPDKTVYLDQEGKISN